LYGLPDAVGFPVAGYHVAHPVQVAERGVKDVLDNLVCAVNPARGLPQSAGTENEKQRITRNRLFIHAHPQQKDPAPMAGQKRNPGRTAGAPSGGA